MALTLPMDDAVPGEIASAADYNILIDNILDLDTRVTALTPGTRYNIERRHNATTSISGGTDTKVPFDTSIAAGSGITYTGGTTRSFTLTNAGAYVISASIRLAVAVEAYIWIAPTSDSSLDHAKTSIPGTSLNLATCSPIRATAGQAWSVWMWVATTQNIARSGTTNSPHVKIEYIGPN